MIGRRHAASRVCPGTRPSRLSAMPGIVPIAPTPCTSAATRITPARSRRRRIARPMTVSRTISLPTVTAHMRAAVIRIARGTIRSKASCHATGVRVVVNRRSSGIAPRRPYRTPMSRTITTARARTATAVATTTIASACADRTARRPTLQDGTGAPLGARLLFAASPSPQGRRGTLQQAHAVLRPSIRRPRTQASPLRLRHRWSDGVPSAPDAARSSRSTPPPPRCARRAASGLRCCAPWCRRGAAVRRSPPPRLRTRWCV